MTGQEECELRRRFGEALCESGRSLLAMLPRPTILGEYCHHQIFEAFSTSPSKTKRKTEGLS